MDSPDTDETAGSSESISKLIETSHMLWKKINDFVQNQMAHLEEKQAEGKIRSWVDSLLNDNFSIIVLLHIDVNSQKNNDQWSVPLKAFTTWIFGALFKMMSGPFDFDLISDIVRLQSKMLMVLSRVNLKTHESISSKYVQILHEMIIFAENHNAGEGMNICAFKAESVIEKMNLQPYPVILKVKQFSLFQVLILQIFLESDMRAWDTEALWQIVTKILSMSELEVRDYALETLVEITFLYSSNDPIRQIKEDIVLSYAEEVIKILPDFDIANQTVTHYEQIFNKLIQKVSSDSKVTNCCIKIIDLIANGYLKSPELLDTVCTKIKLYLEKDKSCCSPQDIEQYIFYCRKCPEFVDVVIHYILCDLISAKSSNDNIIDANKSKLWVLLKDLIYSTIELKKYSASLKYLKALKLLNSWLEDYKKKAVFFETDSNEIIFNKLFNKSESNLRDNRDVMFENFAVMMSFKDFSIHKIVALPWTGRKTQDVDPRLVTAANSLNVSTKIQCLRALLESPHAKMYLNLLQRCAKSDNVEIVVAAVSCCNLLLYRNILTFNEIIQCCIEPAFSKNDPTIQEAVVSFLGKSLCLASKSAQLVRESWHSMNLIIDCKYCDKNKHAESFSESLVNPQIENQLIPFFTLIKSDFKEVRLAISENMRRFSNHTNAFNDNAITKLWLPYIDDPDENIRQNVADSIGILLRNLMSKLQVNEVVLESNVPEELDMFVDLVIDKMVLVLMNVFKDPNPALHKTLLVTARNFVWVPLHLTSHRVLTMFLQSILQPESSTAMINFAVSTFREVTLKAYDISPEDMFNRYQTAFVELIVQRSVYNFLRYSYNLATSLHRTAKCLGFQGSRQFLLKNLKYVICYIVPYFAREPKTIELLTDLSNLVEIEKGALVKKNFNLIYTHLCLDQPKDVAKTCSKIIQELTGEKITDLISTSFYGGNLLPFILRLRENSTRVIEILVQIFMIKQYEKTDSNPRNFVIKSLTSSLHGILVNLDKILRLKYDMFLKKSVIASLAAFINLLGAKHIKQFRYMILVMCRTAIGLKCPGSKKLCCDAMDALVRNLAVEDLGPLLLTICISMVPLLEYCPRESNQIFEFLIIQNQKALVPYISELFFVDDLKISNQVADVIKTCIRNAKHRSMSKNLSMWIKRIKHEIEEIRLKAFGHLQDFLANNRNEINEMIVGDTFADPLINELLDALLLGCQDKQETIRLASAKCIGEIGAVEPRLLKRKIITKEDNPFIANVDGNFAYAALKEMIKALQSDRGSQTNSFSLAIQEILKTFHIAPQEKNQIWKMFTPEEQHFMTPFLTSRYNLPSDETKIPHPIYGSEADSTYETWTYNWVCSMSRNVQDPQLKEMLSNCRMAFQQDIKIAIFFMPFIAVELIIKGRPEHWKKILEEMMTVVKTKEQTTVDQKLLDNFLVRSDYFTKASSEKVSDETRRVRCSQVVFHVLDHLQRWLQEHSTYRNRESSRVKAMGAFFNEVDFLSLAIGAYQSEEYHRAVLYLEKHMTLKNKTVSESLEGTLLAKIYTQLEEADCVTGILNSQNDQSLEKQMLSHNVSGQLQDAVSCYEVLVKNVNRNTKYLQGMVQCYNNLNQPYTSMAIVQSSMKANPELEPIINETEPFWKLANFGMMDDLESRSIKNKILSDLKNGITPDLLSVKKNLVSMLRSPSHPGAYQESYTAIMKLHTLSEFEKASVIMMNNVENMPKIFEEWEKRGQLVRAFRGQEFLLKMRRTILDLALKLYDEKKDTVGTVLKDQIGEFWLKSARIARKAGQYQQAYGYILSANDYCAPQELLLEQAQLSWQKGCQHDAIDMLKRCLQNYFQPTSYYLQLSSEQLVEERKQCAKTKMYYAQYNDKTASVEISSNLKNYQDAVNVWQNSEKSCVAFAEYFESIVEKFSVADKDEKGREFQEKMILYYGRSLQYGCKFIHQSMPRMLTAWIDYATRLIGMHAPSREKIETLRKMTTNIESYCEIRIPPFMWFTAFSQIVSRIGHPSREVQSTLIKILVKVISSFPQQSLWMMASIRNVSSKKIKEACNKILDHEKLQNINTLIRDFKRLWDLLIELSSASIPDKAPRIKVSALSPGLPRLLSSPSFSAIMMPITKFLQLRLPAKNENPSHHNPFPITWHQITGIADEVTVLVSLQKPRKITLNGADGGSYAFICKYKDDLRKDFRFMEFNHIINKFLQKNVESCQRRLYVRTYTVIPLTEDSGLIEWVPNLIGFRHIILGLFREKGHKPAKNVELDPKDSIEKKKKVYLEVYLPSYPQVFGEWFRIKFPDAYSWYESRTAYIRTTAVMSMVGYVMGLGDRHGENINLDSTNGDCVHVDFSCLFNAGEKFQWPEVVPFRLTPNMIHGMGPLKLEGPFRKTCETTLRVLRENSRTLISVLTPFLYDPMVKWKNQKRSNDDKDTTNVNAVKDLEAIELRLKGQIKSLSSVVQLNFSVEGQTNYLIQEATSVDNLCRMFFGWGAFL